MLDRRLAVCLYARSVHPHLPNKLPLPLRPRTIATFACATAPLSTSFPPLHPAALCPFAPHRLLPIAHPCARLDQLIPSPFWATAFRSVPSLGLIDVAEISEVYTPVLSIHEVLFAQRLPTRVYVKVRRSEPKNKRHSGRPTMAFRTPTLTSARHCSWAPRRSSRTTPWSVPPLSARTVASSRFVILPAA